MYRISDIYSIVLSQTFDRTCPHETSEMIMYDEPTLGNVHNKPMPSQQPKADPTHSFQQNNVIPR